MANGQLILLKENFKNMQASVENLQKSQELELSGILFDFGTSTDQLMSAERGFSFDAGEKAILDMRMDQNLGVKAADLLMVLGEKQLAEILFQFGGENDARRIAKEVQKVKKVNPQSLNYVQTLVEIVERVKRHRHSKLHPATKTFQALRIAVNDELNNIEIALNAAFLYILSLIIKSFFIIVSFSIRFLYALTNSSPVLILSSETT